MSVSRTCLFCGAELVLKQYRNGRVERANEFAAREHCSGACHGASVREANRQEPEPSPIDGARWISIGHRRFALVDEADFEAIRKHPWAYLPTDRHVGFRRGGVTTYLHRVLMNATDDQFVDHRSRDALDNRRENLRFATKTQNQQNHGIRRDNKSGFKGVSFDKRLQRWHAGIRIGDGKRTHLGFFDHPQEAALAYDHAARQHHGEFAFCNYPDES